MTGTRRWACSFSRQGYTVYAMTQNKQKDDDTASDDRRDRLPVRRNRHTALIDAPREGVKLVIERGADVYFSVCRRFAAFLNDRK